MAGKSDQDLHLSFLVRQSPEEVFAAINDVHAWWGQGIEGRADRVGASFKYRHKTFHTTTQTIVELVPGQKSVWRVEKGGQINFVKDKSEWDGTEVIFEIRRKGDQTEVSLTHKGLTPRLECFEGCSGGWVGAVLF